MPPGKLQLFKTATLNAPRMLLGFSGWMDGGQVSTGTINCLIEKLNAQKFAQIDPEGFYLYNFPGSMEITALFRPYTKIKDGLIRTYEVPTNTFYASEEQNLILFLGKEPNLNWQQFAECIFSLASEFAAGEIYFIGSVAGLVPHTREPRLFCSVSDEKMKETLRHYGVNFTNYEGPASIVTYLTSKAADKGFSMASLVATIPAYVQGNNPKCVEAVTKRLAGILGLEIELDDLTGISDEFERKLTDVVQEQPELANSITKLEEDYDNEIFDSEMGELKKWLQQQGIRLD
jgi:proteasome assembly chaperone (PAC2) family protein